MNLIHRMLGLAVVLCAVYSVPAAAQINLSNAQVRNSYFVPGCSVDGTECGFGRYLAVRDASQADLTRAVIRPVNPAALEQRFNATKQADGTFELRSVNSGKCLEVYQSSTSDGARVVQNTCNGGANQRFTEEYRAYYHASYIRAVHSGKCLRVTTCLIGFEADLCVVQGPCSQDPDNQFWVIIGTYQP